MNNKYWEVYIGTGTILAKYIVFDMFRPLFWDGQKYREKLKTIVYQNLVYGMFLDPSLWDGQKNVFIYFSPATGGIHLKHIINQHI